MQPVASRRGNATDGPQAAAWAARGRQLGFGVLVAFTLKGICTTALMGAAFFAVTENAGTELLPHLLVWLVACIGGFALLRGAHPK